jgi:hypothetical protein
MNTTMLAHRPTTSWLACTLIAVLPMPVCACVPFIVGRKETLETYSLLTKCLLWCVFVSVSVQKRQPYINSIRAARYGPPLYDSCATITNKNVSPRGEHCSGALVTHVHLLYRATMPRRLEQKMPQKLNDSKTQCLEDSRRDMQYAYLTHLTH